MSKKLLTQSKCLAHLERLVRLEPRKRPPMEEPACLIPPFLDPCSGQKSRGASPCGWLGVLALLLLYRAVLNVEVLRMGNVVRDNWTLYLSEVLSRGRGTRTAG